MNVIARFQAPIFYSLALGIVGGLNLKTVKTKSDSYIGATIVRKPQARLTENILTVLMSFTATSEHSKCRYKNHLNFIHSTAL